MNRTTRSPLTWIISLSLVLSLGCGIIITDNAHAAASDDAADKPGKQQKLAEDLRERARGRQETR